MYRAIQHSGSFTIEYAAVCLERRWYHMPEGLLLLHRGGALSSACAPASSVCSFLALSLCELQHTCSSLASAHHCAPVPSHASSQSRTPEHLLSSSTELGPAAEQSTPLSPRKRLYTPTFNQIHLSLFMEKSCSHTFTRALSQCPLTVLASLSGEQFRYRQIHPTGGIPRVSH